MAAFNREKHGFTLDPKFNYPKESSNQLAEGGNFKVKVTTGKKKIKAPSYSDFDISNIQSCTVSPLAKLLQ